MSPVEESSKPVELNGGSMDSSRTGGGNSGRTPTYTKIDPRPEGSAAGTHATTTAVAWVRDPRPGGSAAGTLATTTAVARVRVPRPGGSAAANDRVRVPGVALVFDS